MNDLNSTRNNLKASIRGITDEPVNGMNTATKRRLNAEGTAGIAGSNAKNIRNRLESIAGGQPGTRPSKNPIGPNALKDLDTSINAEVGANIAGNAAIKGNIGRRGAQVERDKYSNSLDELNSVNAPAITNSKNAKKIHSDIVNDIKNNPKRDALGRLKQGAVDSQNSNANNMNISSANRKKYTDLMVIKI